jgi:hypothetical protein
MVPPSGVSIYLGSGPSFAAASLRTVHTSAADPQCRMALANTSSTGFSNCRSDLMRFGPWAPSKRRALFEPECLQYPRIELGASVVLHQ